MDSLKTSGVFQSHAKATDLATRNGSEVFFASGSTIRTLDLSDSSSYTALDTKYIDFDIVEISFNASGNLLAVVGASRLVVLFLPSAAVLKTGVAITQLKIDETNNKGILKVLWSPLSKMDSNLVVLREDATISGYDLTESAASPYCVYQLNQPHKGFGLTNALVEPVTMCYGSSPKGAMTLYVLDRSADVYVLCPFLPNYLAIEEWALELLLNESSVALTEDESRARIAQAKFVSALWHGRASAAREGDRLCFHTGFGNTDVKLQGPVELGGFPDDCYNADGVDLGVVKTRGALDVFALTLSNGTMLLLAQLADNVMSWHHTKGDSSVLDVIEVVDLPVGNGRIHTTDIPYVFAVSDSGTLVVSDLVAWLPDFEKALASGNEKQVDNAFTILREGKSIYSRDLRAGFRGVASLYDKYPSEGKLLILGDEVRTMSFGPEDEPETEREPAEKPVLPKHTVLGTSVTDRLHGPKKIARALETMRVTGEIKSDMSDDELVMVSDITEKVSSATMDLTLAGKLCHDQIDLQRETLSKQIVTLAECKEKIANAPELSRGKIDTALERQTRIAERLAKLAETIAQAKRSDKPLSKAEVTFFKDLNRIKKTLNAQSGLASREEALREQIAELHTVLASTTHVPPDSHNWSRLVGSLEERNQFLENLTTKFKETVIQ